MSKHQTLIRIASSIYGEVRQRVLEAFPPRHANVCCDTITYAFKVERDSSVPFDDGALMAEVYATWSDENFDALLLRVGETAQRPDGFLLSLTVSLAPGVPRVGALLDPGAQDAPGWTLLSDEERIYVPVEFQRMRLSNLAALPKAA